nr:hypothetical protein [Tanacetum cinerariifolium]
VEKDVKCVYMRETIDRSEMYVVEVMFSQGTDVDKAYSFVYLLRQCLGQQQLHAMFMM